MNLANKKLTKTEIEASQGHHPIASQNMLESSQNVIQNRN